ncbi:hypothetical protein LCGC14_2276880 [marine sediment metagenome]|uniref:Uncharacterized protein n=1 Tax=marine sediment metagenome TaxID=412755 RepID=A0A0F9F7W1_9ZZZZ
MRYMIGVSAAEEDVAINYDCKYIGLLIGTSL